MTKSLLQPHTDLPGSRHYLASNPETIIWGWLPSPDTAPVITMRSGETITIDTVSHEGILEDQGRNPESFFKQFGVGVNEILSDAIEIAAAYPPRDANADGPHVVTGPVAIVDAKPGDILKVDFLELAPRAPYGIVSSRHGYGALPGEMPPCPHAHFSSDLSSPDTSGTISKFCQVINGGKSAAIIDESGRELRFPLAPFLGMIGVTPATPTRHHSVPPGAFGGNIDIRNMVAGTTMYLPVQVPGAGLYVGDPHYAQGHGEVALTALEAPLRATMRIEVIPAEHSRLLLGALDRPFGETPEHWIAVGLHRDLNEAFKLAVREALRVLKEMRDVPQDIAYAYLSAATDFVVSQVVDDVKGVHCLIRKADFARWR